MVFRKHFIVYCDYTTNTCDNDTELFVYLFKSDFEMISNYHFFKFRENCLYVTP